MSMQLALLPSKPFALYPHQSVVLDQLRQAFAMGHRAVCLQAATGFGKTHTAAEIMRGASRRGPVLFMAHLDPVYDAEIGSTVRHEPPPAHEGGLVLGTRARRTHLALPPSAFRTIGPQTEALRPTWAHASLTVYPVGAFSRRVIRRIPWSTECASVNRQVRGSSPANRCHSFGGGFHRGSLELVGGER